MSLNFDRETHQKDVSVATQQLTDHYNNKGTPISCSKGCFFCCRQKVACIPDEVKHLAQMVIDGKVDVDIETLKKQYDNKGEPKDAWCVFLDKEKGECKVYDDRPMMCRKLIVKSDPEECKNVTDKAISIKHENIEKYVGHLFEKYGKVYLHVALYHYLKDK